MVLDMCPGVTPWTPAHRAYPSPHEGGGQFRVPCYHGNGHDWLVASGSLCDGLETCSTPGKTTIRRQQGGVTSAVTGAHGRPSVSWAEVWHNSFLTERWACGAGVGWPVICSKWGWSHATSSLGTPSCKGHKREQISSTENPGVAWGSQELKENQTQSLGLLSGVLLATP